MLLLMFSGFAEVITKKHDSVIITPDRLNFFSFFEYFKFVIDFSNNGANVHNSFTRKIAYPVTSSVTFTN